MRLVEALKMSSTNLVLQSMMQLTKNSTADLTFAAQMERIFKAERSSPDAPQLATLCKMVYLVGCKLSHVGCQQLAYRQRTLPCSKRSSQQN